MHLDVLVGAGAGVAEEVAVDVHRTRVLPATPVIGVPRHLSHWYFIFIVMVILLVPIFSHLNSATCVFYYFFLPHYFRHWYFFLESLLVPRFPHLALVILIFPYVFSSLSLSLVFFFL